MPRHGLLPQLLWMCWSQEQAKRPLHSLSSKARTTRNSNEQGLQCMRKTQLLQDWCKARLPLLLPTSSCVLICAILTGSSQA